MTDNWKIAEGWCSVKIAVLITCHNRKATTLACLEALFNSTLPDGYSLLVYLVDDGSTDGTKQAIREHYPQVKIIKGDGNLYWNGGMRVAFSAAMEQGFDYYLWLNDDTLLYLTALAIMIHTACDLQAKRGKSVIVVGSTQDKESEQPTYGGKIRISKWNPIKYQLITPTNMAMPCDTMNGNCVLIPHSVTQVLGNLDEAFIHTIGDIDYGLRARMNGFEILVMPGYAGLCSHNPIENSFSDKSLVLRERLNRLNGEKGLPLQAWRIFTKRHCGIFWMIFWLWPYLKVILSSIILKRRY